jgi:hypothetical protein
MIHGGAGVLLLDHAQEEQKYEQPKYQHTQFLFPGYAPVVPGSSSDTDVKFTPGADGPDHRPLPAVPISEELLQASHTTQTRGESELVQLPAQVRALDAQALQSKSSPKIIKEGDREKEENSTTQEEAMTREAMTRSTTRSNSAAQEEAITQEARTHGVVFLTLCSARHLPNVDGIWGTCDAFIKLVYKDKTLRSTVKKNSLNPDWNPTEMFEFDLSGELADMRIQLYDWNRTTPSTLLGTTVIGANALQSLIAKDGGTFPRNEFPITAPNGRPLMGSEGQQTHLVMKVAVVRSAQQDVLLLEHSKSCRSVRSVLADTSVHKLSKKGQAGKRDQFEDSQYRRALHAEVLELEANALEACSPPSNSSRSPSQSKNPQTTENVHAMEKDPRKSQRLNYATWLKRQSDSLTSSSTMIQSLARDAKFWGGAAR